MPLFFRANPGLTSEGKTGWIGIFSSGVIQREAVPVFRRLFIGFFIRGGGGQVGALMGLDLQTRVHNALQAPVGTR